MHQCATEVSEFGLEVECEVYPDKSIYPDVECISSPHISPPTVPSAVANIAQCEPLKNRMCSKFYNQTIVPNMIGQHSQVFVLVLSLFENIDR